IWNEKGISMFPTFIQSKRWIMAGVDPLNSKKIPKLTAKEAKTARLAMMPIAALGKIFLPNPQIRNPIKGNKGINQTKSII
ncbi:MAG: hypothetical protein KJ712_01625, partial [Bacteroidetes bacterium]|nr:hypothetical protein [Bacteroidota bacterium]